MPMKGSVASENLYDRWSPIHSQNNRGELPQYLIADDHEPIITREEAAAIRQIYGIGGNGSVLRIPQCISEPVCIQQSDSLRGGGDKISQAENLYRKAI